MECNRLNLFSDILTNEQKCLELSEICSEFQETINIFKIYFCYFDSRTFVFIIFFILLLVILFKFICSTVEEYIAPAILYLSNYLKLSDALAGVTLLAFANGAGDVITAIVASDSKEGISYNVGSLYGAGFFVVTLVIALTIYNSPVLIVVNPETLWRDIGFYVIATFMTLFFAYQGEISLVSSLMMLGLYVVYVLVVVFEDIRKGIRSPNKLDSDLEENLLELENLNEKRSEKKIKLVASSKLNKFRKVVKNVIKQKKVITRMKELIKLKLEKHKEIIHESKIEHIIEILDYPFNQLRKYTIPPCNDEEYDHQLMINWSILGILFIFFAIFTTPSFLWFLIIPISLISYYLLKSHPPKTEEKIPSYFIIINLLGILCGILWTKLCCGVLVDLLTVIGMMTGLSSTYLGLTVIAIGNALPDGLATISIAKQGQAVMGITGGVAGQLFGLLAGFGVSMLKKCIKEKKALKFNLFVYENLSENLLDLLVLFVVCITLIFIIFYGYSNKFVFDKKLAGFLFYIYLGFISLATIIALYQATS